MSKETTIRNSAKVACGTRNLSTATSAATKPAQASHFGRNPVLSATTEVALIRTAMPTQAKL
jgi:hypothetical protein